MSEFSINKLIREMNSPRFYDLRLDESANIVRFKELHKDKFMFIPSVGWFAWDGQVWRLDEVNEVFERTQDVATALDREWGESGPKKDDPDYDKKERAFNVFRTKALGIRSRQLLVAGAQSTMSVKATELNTDPWSLVVENGTLDLKAGTLRDSRPEDLNTQVANVVFDPAATCPRFDAMLDYAFEGDKEKIAYFWRVAGYTLTGSIAEQIFLFFDGVKGAGKTTITQTFFNVLGDYALKLDEEALVGRGQHPTWIVDLLGKRLIFKDEVARNRPLNTTRINELTGSKTLRGRKMGRNFVDIPITAKLFITANDLPGMGKGSANDGIWRRLKKLSFSKPVTQEMKIQDYDIILAEEEGAGILNRALEGLRDYLGNGKPSLRTPESVEDEVAEYQQDEDEFREFITDTFIKSDNPNDFTASFDAMELYNQWCEVNGGESVTMTELNKRLRSSGFRQLEKPIAVQRWTGTTTKKATQRGFLGMQINPESPLVLNNPWKPVTSDHSFGKCKKKL